MGQSRRADASGGGSFVRRNTTARVRSDPGALAPVQHGHTDRHGFYRRAGAACLHQEAEGSQGEARNKGTGDRVTSLPRLGRSPKPRKPLPGWRGSFIRGRKGARMKSNKKRLSQDDAQVGKKLNIATYVMPHY